MTDKERMSFVCGRLYGLSGTVRYQMDSDLRIELKNLAALLARQEVLSK